MAFRVSVPNFSKGEIGPELVARTDVAAYGASVRLGRNVFVRKYGGMTKRPGTRFVAEVYDATQPVRLVPFQFSIEQAYALELGQGYMRAAALGGFVLNEELKVTAITKAPRAQVTAALHAYLVGDQIYFKGVVGMTEINGRTATVLSVVDANNFTVDLDTSGFGTFISADGGIVRTTPPPDPVPDPVIPPVVPPPDPPHTGGGGTICVTDDTLILMANADHNGPGEEKAARDVAVGDYVWTQHEHTLVWGSHRVTDSAFAIAPVMRALPYPDATPRHRFRINGWQHMESIGRPLGERRVWKASVQDARTYWSRHPDSAVGVLSHNLKNREPLS